MSLVMMMLLYAVFTHGYVHLGRESDSRLIIPLSRTLAALIWDARYRCEEAIATYAGIG